MLKATEDLKLQQKKRAEERQIVLSERIPTLPSDLDNIHPGKLSDFKNIFFILI